MGFCAETKNLEENAIKKLNLKNLDFIIANYVSKNQGFGDKKTSVFVFQKNGCFFKIENATKEYISKKLVRLFLFGFR